MKTRLVFIFVIAFLFSFIIKQEDEDVISWHEKRPLSWNDFKGKPQKASAFTNCDILRSVAKSTGNTASVKIQTVFFYMSSWKTTQLAGNSALVHEQKHFDIAEIHARKLRKRIKEQYYHSIVQLRGKTDSLYAIVDKELDVYQDLYDDKTGSSMDGDKQREWNVKIKNELLALKEYSDPVFIVAFK